MSNLASYLAGARSALHMELKLVATLNGISDKTLTRIEQIADFHDPNVDLLISFYRRHGITFNIKENKIISMEISENAREGMIMFDAKNMDERVFYSLPGFFRHIVHLVLKPVQTDKKASAVKDAYKFSVPEGSEKLFGEILTEWIQANGSISLSNRHGERFKCDAETTADDIKSFIVS